MQKHHNKLSILFLTANLLLVSQLSIASEFSQKGLTAMEKNQPEKAITLFQKGAKAGEAESLFYLGRMYESGIGMEQNMTLAIELYQKASDKKYSRATNQLGLLHLGAPGVLQNFDKAVIYLSRAADSGNAEAQFNYASLLLDGKVTKMDPAHANKLLTKSAKLDYVPAQLRLARNYQSGIGLKKNSDLTFYWYNRAATQGNPYALYQVGLRYKDGDGVEKDSVQAHKYLNISLANGYQAAMQDLQSLTEQLTRKQLLKAQKEAKSWRPQIKEKT
jgi:TPR repeat protein